MIIVLVIVLTAIIAMIYKVVIIVTTVISVIIIVILLMVMTLTRMTKMLTFKHFNTQFMGVAVKEKNDFFAILFKIIFLPPKMFRFYDRGNCLLNIFFFQIKKWLPVLWHN